MKNQSFAAVLCCLFALAGNWPTAALGQIERPTEEPIGVQVIECSMFDNLQPVIVAGDPLGRPSDTPANRVDPNTTSSPFAGVGSFFVDLAPLGDDQGVLFSGVLIHGLSPEKTAVRDYVLTVAHGFDLSGGLTPGGTPTGDGVIDVSPADVKFMLNFGGDITQVVGVKKITLHPDWHGFNNAGGPEGASIQDDLAVVQLDAPVPAGVPIYNLFVTDTLLAEVITSVGYGWTGSPSGYLPNTASFSVKHVGLNQMDAAAIDDEDGGTAFELFVADFDGPDSSTNVYDIGTPGYSQVIEGSLGNRRETIIGAGDSGSPSFLSDWYTFDLELGSDGKPIILGINTFTATVDGAGPPTFGSVYGGTLLPSYAAWIDSVIVPEPSSAMMLLSVAIAGMIGYGYRRRQRLP
jgi:hypothetical protein